MFTTILPFDTGVQYCNSACLHGQYPSPYADLPKNCLSKCKGFLVAVYFPMQQRQPEKELTWKQELEEARKVGTIPAGVDDSFDNKFLQHRWTFCCADFSIVYCVQMQQKSIPKPLMALVNEPSM